MATSSIYANKTSCRLTGASEPVTRLLFRPVGLLTIFVAMCAAILGGVYIASRRVPTFYTAALEADPEQLRAGSDELLRRVSDLTRQTNRGDRWELRLTEQQINGWFAVDLAENHQEALPQELQAPRVHIRPGSVTLAGRWEQAGFDAVVSTQVDLYLTEEDSLAIRIRQANLGVLPMPLKQVLSSIEEAALKSGWHVRWLQRDGDPVAVVRLPEMMRDNRRVRLQSLIVGDGEIYLSGMLEGPVDVASLPEAGENETR